MNSYNKPINISSHMRGGRAFVTRVRLGQRITIMILRIMNSPTLWFPRSLVYRKKIREDIPILRPDYHTFFFFGRNVLALRS